MLVAFLAQFQALKWRKEMLNAANIYLFEMKLTKYKYIDRSFDSKAFCGKRDRLRIVFDLWKEFSRYKNHKITYKASSTIYIFRCVNYKTCLT